MKPRVGEMMPTWFSGDASGMSRVLAVEPYRGKYPQWFTWVVKLTALNTRRGWLEMAI